MKMSPTAGICLMLLRSLIQTLLTYRSFSVSRRVCSCSQKIRRRSAESATWYSEKGQRRLMSTVARSEAVLRDFDSENDCTDLRASSNSISTSSLTSSDLELGNQQQRSIAPNAISSCSVSDIDDDPHDSSIDSSSSCTSSCASSLLIQSHRTSSKIRKRQQVPKTSSSNRQNARALQMHQVNGPSLRPLTQQPQAIR